VRVKKWDKRAIPIVLTSSTLELLKEGYATAVALGRFVAQRGRKKQKRIKGARRVMVGSAIGRSGGGRGMSRKVYAWEGGRVDRWQGEHGGRKYKERVDVGERRQYKEEGSNLYGGRQVLAENGRETQIFHGKDRGASRSQESTSGNRK